jgi:hypothetical protein
MAKLPDQPETIRGAHGRRVAEMARADGVLDGTCTWFDRHGEVLTIGWFARGKPFAGTVLNWSLFMPPPGETDPFAWDYYAQDWITRFDASFDSVPPDYGAVLETYLRGRKL